MRRFITIAAYVSSTLLAPVTAWATDAQVVSNNPPGAQYIAKISSNGIEAQVIAQTPLNNQGVLFSININGARILESANYIYHIHDQDVPSDGNCTATLAHLDPYARGETPPCDNTQPQTCQVGDLSGKHGAIPTLPGFSANYTDDYISLMPDTPAYMGNRSFVLHFANKTRIACANFLRVQDTTSSSNSSGSSGSSGSNGTTAGSGSGSTVTSTLGGGLSTATSTIAHPTGSTATSKPSTVPVSGSMKQAVVHHAAVLGPVVFGIAVAVL